jgi:PST family polysaccharide transporter
MGFNVVNFFARNLDNILIGKVWGQTGLGDYDRAYKLLLLPLSQVVAPFASVVLPMLSRTLKDPEVYRRGYFRVLETLLLLTYPGILFALCTSHQLIVTVLGQRWAGIVPIFSILAIGGLLAPISNSTGWLFISQDRTCEMRNWGIISSAMFVISFLVGLPWGPVGVAACYIGVGVFQGPMLWWAVTRSGPVTLRLLLATLFPFLPSGLAAIAAVLSLKTVLPATAFSLVILFVVAHLAFIGSLAAMRPGRALLADLFAQARAALNRRRGGAAVPLGNSSKLM